MTEDTSTIQNDPLNADVGDKDTIKYSLIQDGTLMRFEIRDPKTVATKDTANLPLEQQVRMLNLPCYTTRDAMSTDGRTINKGFPVFVRLFVSVNEIQTAQDVANQVTPYCLAAGIRKGTATVGQIIADPKRFLDGQLFDAKVLVTPAKTTKAGKTYPESNSLKPVPVS